MIVEQKIIEAINTNKLFISNMKSSAGKIDSVLLKRSPYFTIVNETLEHRKANKQIRFTLNPKTSQQYTIFDKYKHSFSRKWVNQTKEQSYEFKGALNIVHLVNDCIKNNQKSFVAFNQGSLVFGCTKQLDIHSSKEIIELMRNAQISPHNETTFDDIFRIYNYIPLECSKAVIALAKRIPSILENQIKKEKYKVINARKKQRQTNLKNKKKGKNAKWVKADRVKVLVY